MVGGDRSIYGQLQENMVILQKATYIRKEVTSAHLST